MSTENKREELGRLVSDLILNIKDLESIGWNELYCRIGEKLFLKGVEESDEIRARASLCLLGFEPDAFETHLEKCSPNALKRILVLLAPDTGDARNEMLSEYARKTVQRRLDALTAVAKFLCPIQPQDRTS